jgi:hypothetical protein
VVVVVVAAVLASASAFWVVAPELVPTTRHVPPAHVNGVLNGVLVVSIA